MSCHLMRAPMSTWMQHTWALAATTAGAISSQHLLPVGRRRHALACCDAHLAYSNCDALHLIVSLMLLIGVHAGRPQC